jgi:hypothetical protein
MLTMWLAISSLLSMMPSDDSSPGTSMPRPRVQVVHREDASLPGTSLNLFRDDPWLAYVFGRDLLRRTFTTSEGATRSAFEVVRADGETVEGTARCSSCHGDFALEAGPGVCRLQPGGPLRDVPSLFGVGLKEMLAEAIRVEALKQLDRNGDGWISLEEAADREVWIAPEPGAAKLFFGRADDVNGDGRPDLNPVFEVCLVDAAGTPVVGQRLEDPQVAGYAFHVALFGHGRDGARTSNLRATILYALQGQLGLQAFDPWFDRTSGHEGLFCTTGAGASHWRLDRSADRGTNRTSTDLSLDDPDGDGVRNEVSEGELDVLEWYLLNAPRPTVLDQDATQRKGAELMRSFGCNECHVPDWQFPRDEGLFDRRFFDLRCTQSLKSKELRGDLTLLGSWRGDTFVRDLGQLRVRGIYTDLRQHDLGRKDPATGQPMLLLTRPLWDAGSSAPYLSDASAPSLHDAIMQHGGEAEPSRWAYERSRQTDRYAIQAFLGTLVLPSVEDFVRSVPGHEVHEEKGMNLAPELLTQSFRRYQARVGGKLEEPLPAEAGGFDLRFLRDSDSDGVPDVVDPSPTQPGIVLKIN